MSEEVTSGKNPNKKLIVILAVAVVLIAAVIIVFFLNNSKLTATTMRVLRLEGTVSLEENCKEKQVKEDLRLKEGNALNTGDASYASVGLDEYKIITLNEDSRAEFNKLGKKLDLSLTEGSMYVDVQKKLASDETFNIHTSSMIVGIRGTSVLVENKAGVESITVTDGTVHVIGTNSVTGESKEIDVPAGKTITVYLYNNRVVDSIMFELTDANYRDLPEFVKAYLREHPETVEKIIEGTDWKAEDLTGSSDSSSSSSSEGGDGDGTPATTTGGEDTGGDDTGGEDTGGDTDGPAVEGEGETGEGEGATVEGSETGAEGPLTAAQIAEARASIVFTNTENGILLLSDGTLFDPVFYAMSNPEVVATYGFSTEALVWHYLHRGKAEGRPPMAPVVTAKEPEIPHFDPNANLTNSSSSSDDDDDDDDHKEETPTPTPSGSTGTWNEQSQVVTVGGDEIGLFDTEMLSINSDKSVNLPLSLGAYSVSNLQGVAWGSSDTGDNASATDTTKGVTVTKHTGAQAATTYSYTDSSGTTNGLSQYELEQRLDSLYN
ncbi:MAG: FecR domain-containing protein [Lachnospiraceae bacterium]|nr:FecR domain-containing protein [Lachnospiraceae bacterium]